MVCQLHQWCDADQTIMKCLDHGTFIPAVAGNRHYDAVIASGQEILPFGLVLEESQVEDHDDDQPEQDQPIYDEVDNSHAEPQPQDLDALKEALRLRILAEAVRRSGMSMELFERINEVHKTIANPNSTSSAVQDAENELLMHGVWSDRAKVIDAAKTQKLVEVMGLEAFEQIDAYDVNAGWP